MKFSMGQQLSQANLLEALISCFESILENGNLINTAPDTRLTLMMLVYPVYYLTFMTSILSQKLKKNQSRSIILKCILYELTRVKHHSVNEIQISKNTLRRQMVERQCQRSDFKLITTISWDPSASRRPLLYTSRPPFLGMQNLITCHDLFANRVSFPSSCSVCCLYYYHFLDRKDEKGLCFSINFTPFKRGCLG